jgi:hypothetical protein
MCRWPLNSVLLQMMHQAQSELKGYKIVPTAFFSMMSSILVGRVGGDTKDEEQSSPIWILSFLCRYVS